MIEEYNYSAECSVCETETDVSVLNNEEKPLFCPMCGTEVKFQPFDKE